MVFIFASLGSCLDWPMSDIDFLSTSDEKSGCDYNDLTSDMSFRKLTANVLQIWF